MQNLDDIFRETFEKKQELILPWKDLRAKNWENWVETNLGNYLDLLPYGNPIFDLSAYMQGVADRIFESSKKTANLPTVQDFITEYDETVKRFFDLPSPFDRSKMRAFIQGTKDSDVRIKILVLVHIFHSVKMMESTDGFIKREEKEEEIIVPIKKEKKQKDLGRKTLREESLLIQEEEREECRQKKKTEFIDMMSDINRFIFLWDSNRISLMLREAKDAWCELDEYSKKDLSFLYEMLKQY